MNARGADLGIFRSGYRTHRAGLSGGTGAVGGQNMPRPAGMRTQKEDERPMSFKRRVLTLLVIAGAHLAFSRLILSVTLSLTARAAGTPDGPGTAVVLLVRVTKLLFFPLVTLALYPREWFPGHWLYVPMVLNSTIWAFGICGLMGLYRKSNRSGKGDLPSVDRR